jgi:hypothetical protein
MAGRHEPIDQADACAHPCEHLFIIPITGPFTFHRILYVLFVATKASLDILLRTLLGILTSSSNLHTGARIVAPLWL